jgi:hypothetical protein
MVSSPSDSEAFGPVAGPVCPCELRPKKTEPLEPCEHRGLTLICQHGRADSVPKPYIVLNPDRARISVVAGPDHAKDSISCKTQIVKGPCSRTTGTVLPHKSRVFDIGIPGAFRSKNDTEATLEVNCERHDLTDALQFLWPTAPLVRSYTVYVDTCSGCSHQGIIDVYPDLEWNFEVTFGLGTSEDEQKSTTGGALESGGPAGAVASHTDKSSLGAGKFKVDLTYDGVKREFGGEFQKYIETCLKAVRAVRSAVDYIAPRLQSAGGAKLAILYPMITASGKWGWEEIKGSPECGFAYTFDFGFKPLIGCSGEIDLLTALLNAAGPVGATLNYIRDLLKQGSDPSEKEKSNLKIDVYIKAKATGQIDTTVSYRKNANERTGTASGGLSVPVEFSIEGGGSIEASILFVKAGAEAKIGGKSGIKLTFTPGTDETGPYVDGVLEFSGITVYAAYLVSFQGKKTSKTNKSEVTAGKYTKSAETISEGAISYGEGTEKEWVWIEAAEWLKGRTYLISGK